MALRQSIETDASAIFTSTSDFAEAVVYNFRAGGARNVNAIVNREPYQFYDAAGNVAMASMTIVIPAASAANGVLITEVDTGGDTVSLLPTKITGSTLVKKSVMSVLSQDFGAIKLALT